MAATTWFHIRQTPRAAWIFVNGAVMKLVASLSIVLVMSSARLARRKGEREKTEYHPNPRV